MESIDVSIVVDGRAVVAVECIILVPHPPELAVARLPQRGAHAILGTGEQESVAAAHGLRRIHGSAHLGTQAGGGELLAGGSVTEDELVAHPAYEHGG